MSQPKTVTFTYLSSDGRREGEARIKNDPDGGIYLFGELGCGKTCSTIQKALQAYVGFREVFEYSVK